MGKAEDDALLKAAEKGDVAAVRGALSKGANVDYKSEVRLPPRRAAPRPLAPGWRRSLCAMFRRALAGFLRARRAGG